MRGVIDVDGVLADWIEAVTSEFPLEIPENPPWDILTLYPEDEKALVIEQLNDPQWWANLPILDGAKEGMAYLKALGHEIKYATAPWPSCIGWEAARSDWLERHFGAHPKDVIPTADKYTVSGHYILDDRLDNVKDYKLHHPQAVCFLYDNAFNQREYWAPRVTWATIRDYM